MKTSSLADESQQEESKLAVSSGAGTKKGPLKRMILATVDDNGE